MRAGSCRVAWCNAALTAATTCLRLATHFLRRTANAVGLRMVCRSTACLASGATRSYGDAKYDEPVRQHAFPVQVSYPLKKCPGIVPVKSSTTGLYPLVEDAIATSVDDPQNSRG